LPRICTDDVKLACVSTETSETSSAVTSLYVYYAYCVRTRTYGSSSSCCNGVVYHSGLQICCSGGRIRYKSYGWSTACCGSTVYRFDILIFISKTIRCGVSLMCSIHVHWSLSSY